MRCLYWISLCCLVLVGAVALLLPFVGTLLWALDTLQIVELNLESRVAAPYSFGDVIGAVWFASILTSILTSVVLWGVTEFLDDLSV